MSIFAITTILSCSNDDEGEGSDCSGFSIEVDNWTNDHNAWAQQNGGTQPITYQWSNGSTTGTIGGSASGPGTLEAGIYTVTVTDGKGCTETGSVTIVNAPATLENIIGCVTDVLGKVNVHITDDGETDITERGIYYATHSGITENDTQIISDYTGVSSTFTITLENLNPSTTYYVRSYVINSGGKSFADEVSFTTNANSSPFTIGQSYQGGIIGGISCDGLHGFIVSAVNVDYQRSWSQANSLCENLTYNGYSDWKLPSYAQLVKMHSNLHLNGLGDFYTGSTVYVNYWSSFTTDDNTVCGNKVGTYYDMDEGTSGEIGVCYQLRTRPVREF